MSQLVEKNKKRLKSGRIAKLYLVHFNSTKTINYKLALLTESVTAVVIDVVGAIVGVGVVVADVVVVAASKSTSGHSGGC